MSHPGLEVRCESVAVQAGYLDWCPYSGVA